MASVITLLERLIFHTSTGTCMCSAIEKPVCVSRKKINAHGDAGDVGYSNISYMPIHTKLCVNMRVTRNRTSQNRCIY